MKFLLIHLGALLSVPLQPPPASWAGGWRICHVQSGGALRSQVPGGWALAGQAEQGPLATLTFWGHRDEGPSHQPASTAPPSRPFPLLPLCRNHEIPVQRQEMGLFLALWGKKRMLPLCSKIYGVRAGQMRSSAGSKPIPAGLLPLGPWSCVLRGSVTHMAALGRYCFQTA